MLVRLNDGIRKMQCGKRRKIEKPQAFEIPGNPPNKHSFVLS